MRALIGITLQVPRRQFVPVSLVDLPVLTQKMHIFNICLCCAI